MESNTQNKFLVVLAGLPASGKSTARARAIDTGAASDSFVYSTDDYIDAMALELDKTYSEVFEDYISKATHEANRALKKAIEAGQNVLWDQTNMTAKKRKSIVQKFPADYVKQCLCILPPVSHEEEVELQRRLLAREGKSIPPHIMNNMRNSFVLPSKDEGFDSVMFFDLYGKPLTREEAKKLFG